MKDAAGSTPIIAVVGAPNVGKSTLFNALTGLRQKVGNFSGVTVEPAVGTIGAGQQAVSLIDLPGLYSLTPLSEDEQLTVDVLRGVHPSIPQPDAILMVMNAHDPEKCLVLFSALAELGIPMAVAVTMVDGVKAQGGVFDDITLAHTLGVRIVPIVGRTGLGVDELRSELSASHLWSLPRAPLPPTATLEERFAWASSITSMVSRTGQPDRRSRAIDAVVLHPILGPITFLAVMALFFQSIFTGAEPLMAAIESLIALLQDAVATVVPEGIVRSFLSKGLLGGVGSVVVFLPQILILNLLISLLEESGYLARAAFLVDRAMGLFGLQGRSFIPLLGSFACAIPGIMSARIIPNYRDRLITIMATPLMTCSARLPVYTLLIGAVIPSTYLFGFLSLQGAVLAGLYVVGALSGLVLALVLKKTMTRDAAAPFLMEFPPYRQPSIRSIGLTMVARTKDFLRTAGTVILAFSIGLWLLTELPVATQIPSATATERAHHQLEQSLAADLGKAIQPVFAPLGFDWKITLGVLSSYAARETFVGAMGQIYSANVDESDEPLRVVLAQEYSLAVGLSILAFYVFALQCISTMAIMRRETGSWKWPVLAFAIMFVMAYASSWVTYTVAHAMAG